MKWKSETYKGGAFRSSVQSVAAKLMAFAMQISVAYFYGADTGTDIFFYLYGIAILLGGVVQTLCTSVLVPQAMLLRNSQSPRKEMEFHNTFFYLFLLIGTVPAMLLLLAGNIGCGYEVLLNVAPESVVANLETCNLFVLLSLLIVADLYLSEILVSHKYFTLGLMCNFVINLFGVLSVLLFARKWDVSLLMYSNCLACLCYLCWVVRFMKKRLGWCFSLVDFSVIAPYRGKLMAFFLNQGVGVVASTFPLYLLAGVQPGLITVVNYGQKIVQAPLSLIQQLAAVLQIKFNELYSTGCKRDVKETLKRNVLRFFLASVFVSAVLFLLSGFVVNILFGLGKMPGETQAVLDLFVKVLVWGLPFTAVSLLLGKVFFTFRKISSYVWIISSLQLLSVVMYALFIPSHRISGYIGISLFVEVAICMAFGLYMYKIINIKHE